MSDQPRPIFACVHCRRTIEADRLDAFEPSTAWEAADGSPSPLGVSWVVREQAHNFALFSRHARAVRLLLFGPGDTATPTYDYQLEVPRNKTGPIWHCRVALASAPEATYYAYEVTGPDRADGGVPASAAGKVLLDPYARSVFFPPRFDRGAAMRAGSNAGVAPLGLLDDCLCDRGRPSPRALRHTSDLVIYEMHVRGFTRHPSSGVPPRERGTFAGIVDKIPYLRRLGVTAVQWMPVFQFDPQEGNYWGYMPLSFFAVHQGYSTDPDVCAARQEFQATVDALHAAGIEVILDVVFNHTCEGDHRGPTYGFRGIDEAEYYVPSADPARPYANFSGTGNTLNTRSPAVRRLVLDSLRYWVSQMGVDGFRFDLASIFTRRADGSLDLEDPPIFAQIASDPVLSRVRLIAEPWDADGAYLLGHRFPGSTWMQWNGRYRDAVQRFVRGDPGMVGEVMSRMYGSCDLFPDDRRHSMRPQQSVNYVTSHDGFTLHDLVAYTHKRNGANGHGNVDGHEDFSDNCGHEGGEDVPPTVLALRRRQAKNLLCLLMLSNGTPMLRMGDEFFHTQGGNSNPYNQDNETSWLDWRRLDEHADLFRFTRLLIAFRKAHPSLCRAGFWREDVQWCGADGPVDLSAGSRCFGFVLRGARLDEGRLCVMINVGVEPVSFRLPTVSPGVWYRWIDTSRPSPLDIVAGAPQPLVGVDGYPLDARSIAVLETREAAAI